MLDKNLLTPIEIEVEYIGKPEDKEAIFEKLQQKLYDTFGCDCSLIKEHKQNSLKQLTIHNPCVFNILEFNKKWLG